MQTLTYVIRTIISASILIMFALQPTMAQQNSRPQQEVIVKTKGRMVRGQHIHGTGLSGAIVNISDGNSYIVLDSTGSLFFPTNSLSFMITSVQKKDFQLVDIDLLNRLHQYSRNPIYIIMETPEQHAQDLLDAQRKIRRTLQEQLRQRENELDELREKNKISEKDYQKNMQKLYDDEKNNERLISIMVKEYAQIDYDQLNELNQRIYDAISNGRLTEADSLIRTKGNIETRIAKVQHEQQIEHQREKEIEKEIRDHNNAVEATQREKDDIVESCILLHKRFFLSLEIDSAIYYLELIAKIDSTNIRYLERAGYFYDCISIYDKAEKYYLKALSICRQAEDKQMLDDILKLQTNLSTVFMSEKKYLDAEALLQNNLDTIEHLSSFSDKEYSYYKYLALCNLVGIHMAKKQYEEAELLSLNIIDLLKNKSLLLGDTIDHEFQIANTLWYLGCSYYYDEKNEKSDSAFLESTNILRNISNADPYYYDKLGGSLSFWALYKSYKGQYEKSESLYMEALNAIKHYEEATNENKELFIAQIWWGLAYVYHNTQRWKESEKLYNDALNVYRRYAQILPQKYKSDLGQILNGFANMCKAWGKFDKSETIYKESLEVYLCIRQEDPQKYDSYIAFIRNQIGELNMLQKKHIEAISFLEESLSYYENIMIEDDAESLRNLIKLYDNLSECYNEIGNYYKSVEYSKKAFDLYTYK